MAGRGPAPKPEERRARGKASGTVRVFEVARMEQPPLPDSIQWPAETLEWWREWGESPLAAELTSTDWSFLKDTAILHAQLWGNADTSVMAELRLRVAKYGATPEDRARLRIQFATADDAEDKRDTKRANRSRSMAVRKTLKAV